MPAETLLSPPETAELARHSEPLVAALRALVRGSPLEGLGPIEVSRTLRVDKTLASRLGNALRARDPLLALGLLPGPVPMRQFIRAARAAGADPEAADAAEQRLQAFQRALQRTFGTRTHLDAALHDALPDTRRRHQRTARQSVYRGMALIKGVSVDLISTTWIVHPSWGRAGRVDIQVVACFLGVRRLRPTAQVRFMSSHASGPPEAVAGLLADLCRPADLSVAAERRGTETIYTLASGSIGRDAAADVYFAELLPGVAAKECAAVGDRPFHCGDVVAHPCKRLGLSILVHEEVWPGCGFVLRGYDTSGRGLADPGDRSWDADRIPLDAAVESRPVSDESLRALPVPGAEELFRRVTAPYGWDLSAGFRQFSCEVCYPVCGTHVLLLRESTAAA